MTIKPRTEIATLKTRASDRSRTNPQPRFPKAAACGQADRTREKATSKCNILVNKRARTLRRDGCNVAVARWAFTPASALPAPLQTSQETLPRAPLVSEEGRGHRLLDLHSVSAPGPHGPAPVLASPALAVGRSASAGLDILVCELGWHRPPRRTRGRERRGGDTQTLLGLGPGNALATPSPEQGGSDRNVSLFLT